MDGTVAIRQDGNFDRLLDNEVLVIGGNTVYRQRVQAPESDVILANILASLGGGGLTDAQLRATPVPVSGTVSTGGLTDAQLRAVPVPVSGTISTTGLTDAELRASAVPVSGTVSVTGVATFAEQQTQTASLSVLDDWDESDRAKVNLIAGQVGVQGASGTVTDLTQRVVLATDVALPAGTNNIGDVDVLTLPAPSAPSTGTLNNGAETAVAGTEVSVLASNANRRSAFIQNVGAANVRVGITGVTATTGLQLTPGATMILAFEDHVTGEVHAIREGAASSTVLAQEITA